MEQQKKESWYSDFVEEALDWGLESGLDWVVELLGGLF